MVKVFPLLLKMRMVHPPIYNIDSSPIPNESGAAFMHWGWVNILELAECLNSELKKEGMPEIVHPWDDIYKRYGLLCETEARKGLTTWISSRDTGIKTSLMPPLDDIRQIYIPAGWADRIMGAVQFKVERVTLSPLVRHEHRRERPSRGGIFGQAKKEDIFLGPFIAQDQKIGHRPDGEKCVIIFGDEGGSTTEEARFILNLGRSGSGMIG